MLVAAEVAVIQQYLLVLAELVAEAMEEQVLLNLALLILAVEVVGQFLLQILAQEAAVLSLLNTYLHRQA
jgi:hypothetical protein